MALVGAEFEDAGFVAGSGGGDGDFRKAGEGAEEKTFGADARGVSGGAVDEIGAEFLVIGIGADAVVGISGMSIEATCAE